MKSHVHVRNGKVFTADREIGPRCGMALSKLALDVELAPDLGIGPRLGTNPRSESYIYIFFSFSGDWG